VVATDVTVRWTTPTAAVDERLLVEPTGEARLLALAPLHDAALIGEFRGEVTADEYAALAATGDHVPIDPTHTDSPEIGAVGALAAQIADRCRTSPLAAALFVLRPTGPTADGVRPLALGVVGRGERACQFLLDLPRCRVRFVAQGSEVGAVPLPSLATGFMTSDADGLGGVRQVAVVPPGVLGAIALELPIPAGAAYAEVLLAGFWYPTDVDETTTPPERFTARAVADLAD
jgi:hypothetical protein